MIDPVVRAIAKGTQPRVCKCGVPVYRVWAWSNESGHQEPEIVDCESTASKRPTKGTVGTGRIHECKAMEKTA